MESPLTRALSRWSSEGAPAAQDLHSILAPDSQSTVLGRLIAVRRLRYAITAIEDDLDLELTRQLVYAATPLL